MFKIGKLRQFNNLSLVKQNFSILPQIKIYIMLIWYYNIYVDTNKNNIVNIEAKYLPYFILIFQTLCIHNNFKNQESHSAV